MYIQVVLNIFSKDEGIDNFIYMSKFIFTDMNEQNDRLNILQIFNFFMDMQDEFKKRNKLRILKNKYIE